MVTAFAIFDDFLIFISPYLFCIINDKQFHILLGAKLQKSP